jgi:hypothetical protein
MPKPAFRNKELKSDLGDFPLAFSLQARQFMTGSRGCHASRAPDTAGVHYHVQVQLVQISSKNNAQAEDG